MKQLGVFSTPPGWDANLLQVILLQFVRFRQQFASTHLYPWVKRGTVRVTCMCLAQEHNTVFSVRAQTQNAPGDDCIDHEATTPPLATYYVEFLL